MSGATVYCIRLLSVWFCCVLGYLLYLVVDTWTNNDKDARCAHYNMLTNLSICMQVMGTGLILHSHGVFGSMLYGSQQATTFNEGISKFELKVVYVLNAMLSAVYVTFFAVLLGDTTLLKDYILELNANVFVVLNNVVHVLPLIVLRECVLLRFKNYQNQNDSSGEMAKEAFELWCIVIAVFWAFVCVCYGLKHAGVLSSTPPVRPDVWSCYAIDNAVLGLFYGVVFVGTAYLSTRLMHKTLEQ